MRILIAGAYGFIGAHIAARLAADGHGVRGAGRDIAWARRRFPNWEWVYADFSKPVDWAAHLAGVDALINCVGVLQDGGRDSTEAAHVAGADALFAACEKAGVRRVVHLSAIGVDGDTAYARTKLAGEAALRARDLDWAILRPSLVIARGVYGGTALVRRIAGAPSLLLLPRSRGLFHPIAMADLCEAVARLLRPDAPSRVTIDAAGPQAASLEELVKAHRRWLGFGDAPVWTLPEPLTRAAFALGDALGALGVRTSLRSTARAQMEHDVGGDPDALPRHLGFAARPYEAALNAEPASVQDRWGARLAFARPFAMLALAGFWIGTGIVCLSAGRAEAIALAEQAGLGALSTWAADWGGAFDIAIGLALLLSRRTKLVLGAMAAVTIGYAAALSFLLSWLWADPLGRLMKLIPFFALLALLAATSDER